MPFYSVDQLKQAIEAKARHRRMLEQIKQQRQRAIQQLDGQINKLRLEENQLQQEIRQQQQDNIKQALLESY